MIPQARADYYACVASATLVATGYSPIKLLTRLDDPIPIPLCDLLPEIPPSPYSNARMLFSALNHCLPTDVATSADRPLFSACVSAFSNIALDKLDLQMKLELQISNVLSSTSYVHTMAKE